MPTFENMKIQQDQVVDYAQPIQLKSAEGQEPLEADQVEQALIKKHMSRFNRWADWRRPYEMVWMEIYRLYLTALKSSRISTRARVALPIVFQVVEAAVPKIVSVIFGRDRFFGVGPRNFRKPKDSTSAYENIYYLLKHQLDLASFFSKFVDFAKQLFLYGTSYMYVYWKVKREWVWERQAIRSNVSFFGFNLPVPTLKWEKKLVYKVIQRRPEIEILDIADVYPDPDARTEEDSDGLYIVSEMSRENLKELSSGKYPCYANYDKVTTAAANTKQEFNVKRDRRSVRGTGEPSHASTDETKVQLITFWGKEDIDGDGIREEVQLVFADKQVLIKAIRNPFEHQMKPVIRTVLFPVPLEWYGLGLVEPIIGLVRELTTIRNQNIDMNNLIINRMWKVSAYADVDLDQLVSVPNGIIVTGEMDGVSPIPQDPIPVSPLQMSQLIENNINNATAPPSIQGSPDSGSLGRTAKGAQLIISQALEKFGMGARLVEEMGVKRAILMMHKLNAQFLDQDDYLSDPWLYGDIFPKEGLSPEEIRNEIDIQMLGIAETATKEAMMNQMISFVNIFKDVQGINLIEIAKTMWDMMQLSRPSEDVIQEAPFPQQQILGALSNPNVSSGTEQAIINQVQRNGSAAPPAIPQ